MKLALVTGASRGLGAALAESLADDHHVLAVARTIGGLEELDDRIQSKGGASTLAPLNMLEHNAVQQLVQSIFDRWAKIDVWLHAAVHAAPLAPTPFIDKKDWMTSYQVNVETTLALIVALEPLLLAAPNGRAIFFDDPRAGEKFFGAYGATKAAQIALARSWQAESVKTGPDVRILQPAPMATATRARFYPGEARTKLASPMDEAKRLLPEILE